MNDTKRELTRKGVMVINCPSSSLGAATDSSFLCPVNQGETCKGELVKHGSSVDQYSIHNVAVKGGWDSANQR